MIRRAILYALLSASLLPAAAAAQGGPGGGDGGGRGHGGGAIGNGMGLGGAGGLGDMTNGRGTEINNVDMRDVGRLNSQGPDNASQTGINNADRNSVLAGTSATSTVTSGTLAGLTTGTTLYSNGTAVGTVQQIRTSGRGSVVMVVVKGTNGGSYAVPANRLTYAGGTLSTSVRLAGINATGKGQARLSSQGPVNASATAIAHANARSVIYGATSTKTARRTDARLNSQAPIHASATAMANASRHSVLHGASTTPLSGVSVGMPFYSNGTRIGTVYRVVTANGVITRVLVQASNGHIYSLAPRALTATSGSVMTSVALRGM